MCKNKKITGATSFLINTQHKEKEIISTADEQKLVTSALVMMMYMDAVDGAHTMYRQDEYKHNTKNIDMLLLNPLTSPKQLKNLKKRKANLNNKRLNHISEFSKHINKHINDFEERSGATLQTMECLRDSLDQFQKKAIEIKEQRLDIKDAEPFYLTTPQDMAEQLNVPLFSIQTLIKEGRYETIFRNKIEYIIE